MQSLGTRLFFLFSNIFFFLCVLSTFQTKREYEQKLADEEAQQLRSFQVKS